jgi:hypothetical protein
VKATAIVLTAGGRDAQLARALDSVAIQDANDVQVVLVANGTQTTPPSGVDLVHLTENVGPAAARNLAAERATGDVIFFLDDDTSYPDPSLVRRALERFQSEPGLGVLTFRIEDPDGAPGQRRHVPRLRAGDPRRSSDVTTFLEGACAIRRDLFERLGGYPEGFFFGHEGTDLAWRAIDAGYRIRYAGDLAVHHPSTPPTRHPDHNRMTARNRVLLARRLLPLPLAALYCTTWLVLGLARAGSPSAVRDQLRGFRQGMTARGVERRPIGWRAVWRMTRAGRPPVV